MGRSSAVRHLNQPILNKEDPAEAALGLTPAEKTRIQSEWQQIREDLRGLETRALQSTDLDGSSVKLTLPDLARERGELAERFQASLTGVLGEARGEVFAAIKRIDDIFSADSGERSITVKTEEVGGGRWGYRMILNDAGGQRVWVGEGIPDEIRHLTDAAGIFPSIKQAVQAVPEE